MSPVDLPCRRSDDRQRDSPRRRSLAAARRGQATGRRLRVRRTLPSNVGSVTRVLALLRGAAIASGTAVIQHDLPLARFFAPPHGIERADTLAIGIVHRA